MWMPTDLDDALKAVWLDPKRAQSVQDGKVTGWPDQFGHTDFTQDSVSRQPAAAVLGGYAAAVWPEEGAFVSLQSLEALSVGWWAVVLQYKDGMAETFDNYDPIIGNGSETSNTRILGNLGESELFLPAFTDQVSINGGETTDIILPRPKSMVSFEWTTAADLWGLGLSNFPRSSAERKWRGPMFEALALRTRPTGDTLDRITACIMHRNGLSGHIPTANPYKTTGPMR
ncbi:hypothetical protein ERN12_02550 [Rhodobacteraceae bacterium]|nr:hypothetical protein ERN12_02550 [Paracoccaceae bacterium]